jgi:hypothetical protein
MPAIDNNKIYCLDLIHNGKINRKDFDLTWNAALEAGGVLVGKDVKITCEIQLVKQS